MSLNKRYLGYKSYQYLEKGVDYREFTLAKEINRVKPYLVPLTASEEEKTSRIVSENPVISLHDHPTVYADPITQMPDYNRQGRRVTAFEGLSKSFLDCVFDNLMDGSCMITSKSGWKWNDVLYDLGMNLEKGAAIVQIDPSKEIAKTIFLCIVTSLVFWAMFHANEGVATVYPWIGGFFAAMGGIGIVIGLPWTRRVSLWKRLPTI